MGGAPLSSSWVDPGTSPLPTTCRGLRLRRPHFDLGGGAHSCPTYARSEARWRPKALAGFSLAGRLLAPGAGTPGASSLEEGNWRASAAGGHSNRSWRDGAHPAGRANSPVAKTHSRVLVSGCQRRRTDGRGWQTRRPLETRDSSGRRHVCTDASPSSGPTIPRAWRVPRVSLSHLWGCGERAPGVVVSDDAFGDQTGACGSEGRRPPLEQRRGAIPGAEPVEASPALCGGLRPWCPHTPKLPFTAARPARCETGCAVQPR